MKDTMTIHMTSLKAHLSDFVASLEGFPSTEYHRGLDDFVKFLDARGVPTGGIVQDMLHWFHAEPVVAAPVVPSTPLMAPPVVALTTEQAVTAGAATTPNGQPIETITQAAADAITAADAAAAVDPVAAAEAGARLAQIEPPPPPQDNAHVAVGAVRFGDCAIQTEASLLAAQAQVAAA